MDTNITNEDIKEMVSVKNQIPLRTTKKIISDIYSKIDLILNDCSIPNIVISQYVNLRKKHFTYRLNFELVNNDIFSIYKDQFIDCQEYTDIYKTLIDTKLQYINLLSKYNVLYSRTFSCPFEQAKKIITDNELAESLFSKQFDIMLEQLKKYESSLKDKCTLVESSIIKESIRLNTTSILTRRKERIRILEKYAENVLNNIISYISEYKNGMINIYEKAKNKKFIEESTQDQFNPASML